MLSWCRRRDFPGCRTCGRAQLVDLLCALVRVDEDAIERRRVTDDERATFDRILRGLDQRLLADWLDRRILTAYRSLVGLLELREELDALDPTDPVQAVIEDVPGVLTGPGVEQIIEMEIDDETTG
jgi:hypothetical protein